MATDVIMPSLGFDMTEGTLAQWLKKEGDKVEKGEPIAEIETEKATVELEAQGSGVLRNITAQPGATVKVGTVMATLEQAGDAAAGKRRMSKAKEAAAPPPQEETPEPAAENEAAETAPAAGQSPAKAKDAATPAPKKEAASQPKPEPAAAQEPAQPAPPAERRPAKTGASGDGAQEETRIKISPIARRIAENAGLDILQIKGSGPDGRIVERDVEEAVARAEAATSAPPAAGKAAPEAAPSGAPAIAETQVALNRMRQTIARRMAESKQTVPHFYATMSIDMTEAMKMREQLNNLGSEEEKITVNDLVVAAAARTLLKFPVLNASFKDDHLEMHGEINVGIAVPVEDGLLVPVLRNADRKALRAMAIEAKGLAERARTNKMRSEDMGPATFTVSNLGMLGVEQFAAIINPPEAAILAVGAVAKQPVVVGDDVRVAAVMKVTLSIDHRVADGVLAGRYLQELKKLLENPVNLVAG